MERSLMVSEFAGKICAMNDKVSDWWNDYWEILKGGCD